MANVKVRYLGSIKRITGKDGEEIAAETLGALIDVIGRRYRDKEMQYYLAEKETTTDPSLIITYNGQSVGRIKDYEMKLKDGDEITLMTVISGG